VKLVHLVGFLKNKFVTIHGHMNLKKKSYLPCSQLLTITNILLLLTYFCHKLTKHGVEYQNG